VVLNPGSKSARIYITVDGNDDDEKSTLEALVAARGYIRHTLKERMGIRYVPELSFHIDKSENLKMRIDELLGRMKKRAKTPATPEVAESKPQ
jgi:ribosome-binding factor A